MTDRHADLETTAGYLAMVDDDIRETHRAASPFESFSKERGKP